MRIALTFLGRRGGGERYTLELARALTQASGVELRLVLGRDASLRAEFELLETPELTISTYRTTVGFVAATIARGWSEYGRVRAWVRRERIDVLIMGMIHPWSPLIVRAARSSGARVISVVHEPEPHPGDPVAAAALMRFAIGDCVRHSDARVALTLATASRVAALHGELSTRVIPHGVFAYHAQHEPRQLDASRPVRLLFFGRIAAHKGLGELLAAVERLQSEDAAVALEICGDGDLAPYAGALARLKNVRVDNRWIADAEIVEVFRRVDICVLPYLQASQSGVVGIAQAAGLPVVAFPEPGIVEQLAAGGGAIAMEATVGALVVALRTLIGDASLYRSLSADAITAARSASWSTIAAGFVELAAALVDSDKAGATALRGR